MNHTDLTFTDHGDSTIVQYGNAPFLFAYKVSDEDNGLNCLDVLELEVDTANEAPDWTSEHVRIVDQPEWKTFERIVEHLEAMPEVAA